MEVLKPLINDNDEDELAASFNKILRKFEKDPKSNPHLDLNIDDITRKYEPLFKGFEAYRRYFMDFKSLFSIYHYLYPFYTGKESIECFPLIDLEKVQNRWVDQIARLTFKYLSTDTDTQRFLRRKHELSFQREDGAYPLEGNFIAPKDVENQWLMDQLSAIEGNFSQWVDLDLEARRKNIKNRKKKERKKRNKATEKQARLATSKTVTEEPSEFRLSPGESLPAISEVEDQDQIKNARAELSLDSVKDDALHLEAKPEFKKTSSALGTSTLPVEFEDEEYGISYQEYASLIKSEKQRTLEKVQEAKASASSSKVEDSQSSQIILTGGAARIYLVAMGLDHSKVRNRDLQQFLNQVGGYFVKCSGRHSDPKIALPNFNENATNPFWVDKMHLMHSGAEHFPISRLRTHLNRMIIESGLYRFVKVEI